MTLPLQVMETLLHCANKIRTPADDDYPTFRLAGTMILHRSAHIHILNFNLDLLVPGISARFSDGEGSPKTWPARCMSTL